MCGYRWPVVGPQLARGKVRRMGTKSVMTVDDVACELGFDRSTVYRWIHLGKGPRVFRSPGGHIRIRRSDFIEWTGQANLSDER
ncbi:helix-turn-helix domain-containing protein [Nocardiopsis rhodophaea]|uniref:helix-turn-helix domain-containing protein n=1 Tax=Nocardiopsis rhodophaea TaxID=280238 RepID=UPI00399CC17C